MSPLARLPQITLHVEKFINVVGIVEPELHPDERFPALDGEHVPWLGLGEKFTD